MSKKGIFITIIITLLVTALYGVNIYFKDEIYNKAKTAYRVYLHGKSVGIIQDEQLLYDLINKEQQEIKTLYGVDNVYPPDSINITKENTYNANYASVSEIYNIIAQEDDFTIKGYIASFKNEEDQKNIHVNILDKTIFEESMKKFVLAFISEDDYEKYINDEFGELNDIGKIIKNMYFEEDISIKEGYISVKDKIFTDVDSLSQYLLFGEDAKMDNYTVKLGDNIESISSNYKLNPQEFIIANPEYRDESVMLKVGDSVNVTLLNPIISFVYDVYQIEDETIPYIKETTVDYTMPAGYSEVTQSGVTGIRLTRETYQVKNGEQSSQVNIESYETIREVVNEIKTVGPTYRTGEITGTYVDIGGNWGWPTLSPYVITSRYAYRWGKIHEGIDISGTGYASPIFAIADGVVVNVKSACKSCPQWANGNYVVIEHANNIYSAYLHLSSFNCSVGQTVKKGDRIAAMGQSGYAFGTHLHLGLYEGEPFVGGETKSFNPLGTIYAGL